MPELPEESEAPDDPEDAESLPDESDEGAAADEPELDSVDAGAAELPDDDVPAVSARAVVVASVALVPAAPLPEAVWSSAPRRSQPTANTADSNTVRARAFEVFDLAIIHESFPGESHHVSWQERHAHLVGFTVIRLARRQGAMPFYLLVSELVAPGVPDEPDEPDEPDGLEEELPAAPGADELGVLESVVPDVPPAALPLPDALPDASAPEVLEPEVPAPGVAVPAPLVEPAPAALLSVEGDVAPEVDPAAPVPLVEPAGDSVADEPA